MIPVHLQRNAQLHRQFTSVEFPMFDFIESLTTKRVFVEFDKELKQRFPDADVRAVARADIELVCMLRDAVNAAFLAGYLVGRDPDKLLLGGVLAEEERR